MAVRQYSVVILTCYDLDLQSQSSTRTKTQVQKPVWSKDIANSAITLGRMSLDKSLHMRLKTLLATLFSGSVHTSHTWSDLSSHMCWRTWTMCPRMWPCFSMKPFTLRHMSTHIYARTKYRRCRTLLARMSEWFHTRTHVRRQIGWEDETNGWTLSAGCADKNNPWEKFIISIFAIFCH